MSNQSDYLIVVGASARMLAHAVRAIGYKPLAIDLYGDRETLQVAEDFRQVNSLEAEKLGPVLDELLAMYPVRSALYGSGFETAISGLVCLQDRCEIYGNPPAVFSRLHDKPYFFATLAKLDIPFPQVSFNPPQECQGWLQKPCYGQGGMGVHHYRQVHSADDQVYWQRYQSGQAQSVLFLADGQSALIVGFNRQWAMNLGGKNEFAFCGIMNGAEISNEQKQSIQGWLDSLVPYFNLRGLNSLDFINDGKNCHALEINPRTSASMQLYSERLLQAHMNACRGLGLSFENFETGVTAYQIVYSRRACRISQEFVWPDEAVDIPKPFTVINAGQPICSMITSGCDPAMLSDRLQLIQNTIIEELERTNCDGF